MKIPNKRGDRVSQEVKNGIVMEVKESELVVMTPDGEFLHRPYAENPPQIGEEISFTVATRAKPRTFLTRWRQAGLAVAAMLLLFILTPAMINQLPVSSEMVAYVTVDVNPSIELGVNNKDKIVSAKALSESGNDVLESLNLIDKRSEEAITEITRQMVAMGYIKAYEANKVMISVRSLTNNKELTDKLSENLVTATKVALAQDDVKLAIVSAIQVDEELRLSAEIAGVSPGKYVLMLEENPYSSDNDYTIALESDDEPAPTEEAEQKNDEEKEESYQIAMAPELAQESNNSSEQIDDSKVDENIEASEQKETTDDSGDKEDKKLPGEEIATIASADLLELKDEEKEENKELEESEELEDEELDELEELEDLEDDIENEQ